MVTAAEGSAYHPYWTEDQAEYAKRVQVHAAKPPALLGSMTPPASNADVSSALYRCLSPDPAARPTAGELRAILSGRDEKVRAAAAAVASAPASAPASSRPAGEPIMSERIELSGPDGKSLRVGVRTELGKTLVRQFGPDGEFWDNRQCVLERDAKRQWVVSPVTGATNETLVNGETLTMSRPLRHGDLIAVGRRAKGIVKMPLTVRGV